MCCLCASPTVPPSAPKAITVSDIGPFLATVSWQPPLEDGGAVGPLMYTVTLTNESVAINFNPTTTLTMNLPNLQHSVSYRVQVVAGNEAGMGPAAAEVMFRTENTGKLVCWSLAVSSIYVVHGSLTVQVCKYM